MKEEKGVFVTLKKNGELRGCVGLPLPRFPLGEAVKKAARSAADDRRFHPIKKEELEEIDVEVTVLTVPERIEVDDPEEYLERIEVGKHGLMIEHRGRQGLLLPQVPLEQDWNCREYLEGLCKKAMLRPDEWKDESAKIMCFEGQIFKEGNIPTN